ncbi:ABC transporter ATP-binding protein [bacterium]|nr:ABC transporter ATP-binding protein [bacterium]
MPSAQPGFWLSPADAAAAPASSLPQILELKHVGKAYPLPEGGVRQALEDINISIADVPGRGQCKVLLGPSGCGKSTILRLIAGLIKPSEGEVLLDGKPVSGPGSDRGMVFQSYSSFPWLSVLDNVRYGLDLAGTPRSEGNRIARELIEIVGLKGAEDLYPKALSGGMRQRVAIARTLAVKPRIILMDEPFGALDPMNRQAMQDLVARLWFDGELNPTFIFVTHDIEEAIFLADSIIVLSAGPGRVLAELEAPPPTPETRRGITEGRFNELENYIIELIYGPQDGRHAFPAGKVLGG